MRDDPPNPYRDLPLSLLAETLNQRAGELLKGARVGRRDIAYLLIAASWPLRPLGHHAQLPDRRVQDGACPDEVYGEIFESEAKVLRYHAFKLAVDAIGLRPPHVDKTLYGRLDALGDMAQRDNAGLHQALRLLGALRPAPSDPNTASDD